MVEVRCLSAGRPSNWRGGRCKFGLRLNKEDNGGRVPRFEEGDMVPGCLLGVRAAARTAVGRPFDAPSGMFGPEKTIRNERRCFCFWYFVCFMSRSAQGKGSGDECCFLFSKCSPSEAALNEKGSDDDGCMNTRRKVAV